MLVEKLDDTWLTIKYDIVKNTGDKKVSQVSEK